MKRKIYITGFIVLGLLVAVLAEALFELYLLKHTADLETADIASVRVLVAALLFGGCGVWGYESGKYWWHQLYELKKFKNRWFRKYDWS